MLLGKGLPFGHTGGLFLPLDQLVTMVDRRILTQFLVEDTDLLAFSVVDQRVVFRVWKGALLKLYRRAYVE